MSPRLEYCFRPRTVIVAEAFCESPACSRLRRGGSAGFASPGFASRGLYSQSLLARQLALLQLLLAPQQPLLGLQRPLRPPALRLFQGLQAACPDDVPLTPVGRLEAMEKRLAAMLQAAKLVQPALDEFYSTLGSEQKARFNALKQFAGN